MDVQQFYLVQNYVKMVIQSHSTGSNDTHFDWLLRMIRGIRMTPTREKIELWRSRVVREDLEQRTRGYVGFLWRNKFPMRFFVGGNLFFRVDTSHKKILVQFTRILKMDVKFEVGPQVCTRSVIFMLKMFFPWQVCRCRIVSREKMWHLWCYSLETVLFFRRTG